MSTWREVHVTAQQVARYVLVGSVVYAVDIVVFITFSKLGIEPAKANIFAKFAGAATGFLLHRKFTFRDPSARYRLEEFIRYIGLLVFNTVGTTALILVCTSALRWPALPSKVGADVISILVSFIVAKHFIFRSDKAQPTQGTP